MRKLSLFCLAISTLFGIIAIKSTVVAFRLNSSRSTSTTTTSSTTESTAVSMSTPRPPVYINNKLPTVDVSCMVHYKCVEKLKGAKVPPKPCVKYCVKLIECPNAPKIRGSTDQCVELDEAAVRQQYEENVRAGGEVHTMKVAMIDFPCRPGFLPDDMGRCREVW